jgi:hypothetical protein
MNLPRYGIMAGVILTLAAPAPGWADDTVATAVYARADKGYKRERLPDGSFKPEFYALANGGRIAGTSSDITVDRVTYPEVAQIAARLLGQQNYHYGQSKEQATLLIVLQWGATIAFDNTGYAQHLSEASKAIQLFGPQGMGSFDRENHKRIALSEEAGEEASVNAVDAAMSRVFMDNRVRDQINARNARVLGYLDDINESNDIRRWAGGGDRYNDLIADVEETRYYIVISAYDFPGLLKQEKQRLLWQTRVSVRSPGNRFDHSFVPMLKSASKYFDQDSGKLVREEQEKAKVELGDLKFLGEAQDQSETKPETKP